MGEWCRRSLLCVHIALISSLRAAAGGVLLLGGVCLVASSGVPPLDPPGGGEVLLVPNSGLGGDGVLVSVRFFLVDVLHALEGSESLALPVSLCDGVAALTGESGSGKLGE